MCLSVTEPVKPAVERVGFRVVKPALLSANEWAVLNHGGVDLGDKRRNVRAVQMAASMAAHPEFSLPRQMQGRNELDGAYGVLNNAAVTMEALMEPHRKMTLAAANRVDVVLMVEDSTELDYTAHPSTTGLGPIGDGKECGFILHSTLAVDPQSREILGLTHAEVVLRQPAPSKNAHWTRSPEAKVWETSAKKVGSPSSGSIWVHVSDRGSDSYDYMVACEDHGKHFLLRACHDRVLQWDDGTPQAGDDQAHVLLRYVRSLAPHPGVGYTVHVPARNKKPAREAQVVLQWVPAKLPPPKQGPRELRKHVPIAVRLLQLRQAARETPDKTAATVVEPLMVTVLALRLK